MEHTYCMIAKFRRADTVFERSGNNLIRVPTNPNTYEQEKFTRRKKSLTEHCGDDDSYDQL